MAAERLLRGALIAALALCAGCTETDDQLVDEIGVTRLLLVAPGLDPQAVSDAVAGNPTLQLATWKVETARLDLGGTTFDLLFGEPCTFTDTAGAAPTISGACAGGLVVGSTLEPIPMRLSIALTMQVARADPTRVRECVGSMGRTGVTCAGDSDCDAGAGETCEFDGDGIPDDDGDGTDDPCPHLVTVDCDDNCPHADNPTQADTDGNGTGDGCTGILVVFGVPVGALDSDGDGVVDSVDNCAWVPNPGQDPLDPIGVDCEQIADVRLEDSLTIELDLGPAELLTFEGLASFVTVDFDVGALSNCVWNKAPETSTCELPAGGNVPVVLCGRSTSSSAVAGC